MIGHCAIESTLPLFQDDREGNMWEVLGEYDSLIIVNRDGVMANRFSRANLPERSDELVAIVNDLL